MTFFICKGPLNNLCSNFWHKCFMAWSSFVIKPGPVHIFLNCSPIIRRCIGMNHLISKMLQKIKNLPVWNLRKNGICKTKTLFGKVLLNSTQTIMAKQQLVVFFLLTFTTDHRIERLFQKCKTHGFHFWFLSYLIIF